MDYLRSFVIGSSSLITISHFIWFYFEKEKTKDYPFKLYSIFAPIYYGVMSMLSLYIGKIYGLSLEKRLFIVSIISIIVVISLSWFITRKRYEPYKSWKTKDWIYYIIQNGTKHFIAFNLIIYNFEKYFSSSDILKAFIIGGSIISYLFIFLIVIQLSYQNKVNYNYKKFVIFEPLLQSFNLIFICIILPKLLNISLKRSFLVGSILIPTIWLIGRLTKINKIYNLSNKTLMRDYIFLLIYAYIKYNIVLQYLYTHL